MLRAITFLCAIVSTLVFVSTSYASPATEHSHAGRVHKHVLPKALKIKHRHGNGAAGQFVKPSVKKQPEASKLQQFYKHLSNPQKQRIQEALVWVIDTPTPLDLPFNSSSYALIKQWQKATGFKPDGKLDQAQIKRLEIQARTAKNAVEWTIYRADKDNFQIGVPNRFAQKKSFNEAGGVEFSSFNKHYTLSLIATDEDEIDSFLTLERNNLANMYEQMHRQFKSEGLSNIRQRKNADGFMLSGVQNGEILYVNFMKKGTGHAGYLLSLPYTKSTRAGTNTLLAATALSFRVDAEQQTAKANGKSFPKKLNKRSTPPLIRNRGSRPLSAEAIFQKVNNSVWLLYPSDNRSAIQGSAVAINKHFLLTNCHVMGNAKTGKIRHKGRKDKTLDVTLFALDKRNDRCVLKSRSPLPSFVGIRPYKNINVGEKVYTIGAPQGLSLTIAEGLLSSKREEGNRRLLQTSAPISQGSSGGGLFDSSGNLLGITTLMSVRGQNLNFAIPAEEYWSP